MKWSPLVLSIKVFHKPIRRMRECNKNAIFLKGLSVIAQEHTLKEKKYNNNTLTNLKIKKKNP
jgi:hypothetical protein